MSSSKKAHFIGICGAGMSGVAILLRESGWQISGSDAHFYPPVSNAITAAGLSCQTPYDPANIPIDAARIIIGKHARLTPESNSEVAEAFRRREAGLSTVESYPDVLDELTADRKSLVIAGSYGKSSTTALTTWILHHAGKSPSYFIGAVPLDLPNSAALGSGDFFVLEGDEYPSANWDKTPKFCRYNSDAALLTSGEHDHHNEFVTVDDYLAPYRRLVSALPNSGLLIACRDGEHVLEIASEAKCRVITYTSSEDKAEQGNADYILVDYSTTVNGSRLTIDGAGNGSHWGTFVLETNLIGRHNAQNVVGAAALLIETGAATVGDITAALPHFHGLRRRLERKTDKSTIALYEDLSSSRPKALAALGAVRGRHPHSKLIAVFQPHTFSFRSRNAKFWYDGLFADADSVLVFSPPELEGLGNDQEMSHAEILQAIRDGNRADVHVVHDADSITDILEKQLQPGDALLLMTSGGMGGSIEPIQRFLEQRFPVKSEAA